MVAVKGALMTDSQKEAPKIEFPCDYPLKVIGVAGPDFQETVATIVRAHAPEFDASSIDVLDSRNGKYLSLRFSIQAQSEEHIRRLFLDLKAHSAVQMVL